MCTSRVGKVPTNALTVVLKTRGCSFAKRKEPCRFCTFHQCAEKNPRELGPDKLAGKLASAVGKYDLKENGIGELRIYNGGSLLANAEVRPNERAAILSEAAKLGLLKLLVESRPEHINDSNIKEAKIILKNTDLEVAIGLETANDALRTWLKKGFSSADFEKAIRILAEHNVVAGAYVLVKARQMSEDDAVGDALATLEYLARLREKLEIRISARLEPFAMYEGMETSDYKGHTPPSFSTILKIIKNAPDNLNIFVGWSDGETNLAAKPTEDARTSLTAIKPLVDEFNSTGDLKVFEKFLDFSII